jgi:hypothetical protein
MSLSHSHLTKYAELDYCEKNRLDYCPETTSFAVTESTRDGCIAKNSGASAL